MNYEEAPGILADWQIRRYAMQFGMIEPYVHKQQGDGVISFGPSSYGYDIRIANEFKVFTNTFNTVVDPKHVDERSFVTVEGPYVDIPPNSFALGRSVEMIRMPKNVLAFCLGKSTYARCGIIANFTPFEPGWRGYVTVELTNSTPLPARIYANEGIAQVVFFQAAYDCEVTYEDRKGKYNGQEGITTARVQGRPWQGDR